MFVYLPACRRGIARLSVPVSLPACLPSWLSASLSASVGIYLPLYLSSWLRLWLPACLSVVRPTLTPFRWTFFSVTPFLVSRPECQLTWALHLPSRFSKPNPVCVSVRVPCYDFEMVCILPSKGRGVCGVGNYERKCYTSGTPVVFS